MSNPRIIYKLRFFEETDLQKQLDWSNKCLFNANPSNIKFNTLRGEIYRYNKSINKSCFLVVLMDSNELIDNVLICPIYVDKHDGKYIPGLDIGLIPELSLNHTFVAAIHEIHFISKSRFVLDRIELIPIYYGRLLEIVYLDIIYNYKKLLEIAMRNKNKGIDMPTC